MPDTDSSGKIVLGPGGLLRSTFKAKSDTESSPEFATAAVHVHCPVVVAAISTPSGARPVDKVCIARVGGVWAAAQRASRTPRTTLPIPAHRFVAAIGDMEYLRTSPTLKCFLLIISSVRIHCGHRGRQRNL